MKLDRCADSLQSRFVVVNERLKHVIEDGIRLTSERTEMNAAFHQWRTQHHIAELESDPQTKTEPPANM